MVTYALCFVAGTAIRTPRGEVRVETLRPGDLVTTPDGAAPVYWVGRRAYGGRFIAGNHLVLPIRIRRGALADDVPSRDLQVSPGHGVWCDGVLVPAWRLVNGVSVTQATTVDHVEYYHLELEEHRLLFAHGAALESFLDDGQYRNQFQNVASYWALYPDAPLRREMTPLPRVEAGFRFAEVKARIDARAGIAPAPAAPGPLRGHVDVGGVGGMVCGWAQDVAHPEEPVVLRVYSGAHYVARVIANAYRADLRAAALGSGCHSFECRLPSGCTGEISVRREADGAVLPWTGEARAAAS